MLFPHSVHILLSARALTRAERVVSPEELLARRKVLSLCIDALEVVDVAEGE